jgi:hypothetical protein
MGIFIAIIVALLVGLFLGSYLFFLLITQAFKQDPSMVIEQLCKSVGFQSKAVEDHDLFVNAANGEVEYVSKMVLDKAIELQVEKHGSQYYLYFKDSSAYVSQGSSVIEALERAHERYPGNDFVYTLDE